MAAYYAIVSNEHTKECFIEKYNSSKLYGKRWSERDKINQNIRLEAVFTRLKDAEQYIDISIRFHTKGWKYNKAKNRTIDSAYPNPKQRLIDRGLSEAEAKEFLTRRNIEIPERDLQIAAIYDTPEELAEHWFTIENKNDANITDYIKNSLDMKTLAHCIIKNDDQYMKLKSGRVIRFPSIVTKYTCEACENDYCYCLNRTLTNSESELCEYCCIIDAKKY